MQGKSQRLPVSSRLLHRLRAREHGQGIVEFAAIFPVFIVLVFVMIDGGLLMGRYNQVNHAAQEGARLAASGEDLNDVASRVRAQSINLLQGVPTRCSGPTQICVEWFDGPNTAGEVGSYVRVTVRYDYNPITPIDQGMFGMLGFPNRWDVDSCAIAQLERPHQPPASNTRSGTPSC
jgi:Flp pilus assembly protein TadG